MQNTKALTPSLRRSPSTLVRKRRELPVPGMLKVKVGEKVEANDIVAEAKLPGDLSVLRLPEQMGVSPHDVVQGMKVKTGDWITKGTLISEHPGLFGLLHTRSFAPHDGKIEFFTEGNAHLGLRCQEHALALNAYINGTVVSAEEGKSIEIESHCTFIQGIFGVGGEKYGKVCILEGTFDKVLSAEDIPDGCSGEILVGGVSIDGEGLARAAEAGAVGLITASIDDEALSAYLGFDLGIALTGDEPVSMSVVVTEGFGRLGMSEGVKSLLIQSNGSYGSLSGATQVRAGALRPEIILPPLRGLEHIEDNLGSGLDIGLRVRLIRVPYFGSYGTVKSLPIEKRQIETGAHTRVAEVILDSGEAVVVPRANLELIS